MPSPSEASPGRGLSRCAPKPGPSSSTWTATQPRSASTRTFTRPSATRHALSRTLRTARHSATGSMWAHASPPVKQTSCAVARRIPVTTSAVSSSTRMRSGPGGGRPSSRSRPPSSSSCRSRWSSQRVSPRICSTRARLVSPMSSATTTAEASMMMVPSSCLMSCRSRLLQRTCSARSAPGSPWNPRGSAPASVPTPAGAPTGDGRDRPSFMRTPVRSTSTRLKRSPADLRMSSQLTATDPCMSRSGQV